MEWNHVSYVGIQCMLFVLLYCIAIENNEENDVGCSLWDRELISARLDHKIGRRLCSIHGIEKNLNEMKQVAGPVSIHTLMLFVLVLGITSYEHQDNQTIESLCWWTEESFNSRQHSPNAIARLHLNALYDDQRDYSRGYLAFDAWIPRAINDNNAVTIMTHKQLS